MLFMNKRNFSFLLLYLPLCSFLRFCLTFLLLFFVCLYSTWDETFACVNDFPLWSNIYFLVNLLSSHVCVRVCVLKCKYKKGKHEIRLSSLTSRIQAYANGGNAEFKFQGSRRLHARLSDNEWIFSDEPNSAYFAAIFLAWIPKHVQRSHPTNCGIPKFMAVHTEDE